MKRIMLFMMLMLGTVSAVMAQGAEDVYKRQPHAPPGLPYSELPDTSILPYHLILSGFG